MQLLLTTLCVWRRCKICTNVQCITHSFHPSPRSQRTTQCFVQKSFMGFGRKRALYGISDTETCCCTHVPLMCAYRLISEHLNCCMNRWMRSYNEFFWVFCPPSALDTHSKMHQNYSRSGIKTRGQITNVINWNKLTGEKRWSRLEQDERKKRIWKFLMLFSILFSLFFIQTKIVNFDDNSSQVFGWWFCLHFLYKSSK